MDKTYEYGNYKNTFKTVLDSYTEMEFDKSIFIPYDDWKYITKNIKVTKDERKMLFFEKVPRCLIPLNLPLTYYGQNHALEPSKSKIAYTCLKELLKVYFDEIAIIKFISKEFNVNPNFIYGLYMKMFQIIEPEGYFLKMEETCPKCQRIGCRTHLDEFFPIIKTNNKFIIKRVIPMTADDILKRRELLKSETVTFHPVPCTCEGPCDKNCPCFLKSNFCEKFCRCIFRCQMRYNGCFCKKGCIEDDCKCRAAGRECTSECLCNNINYKYQCCNRSMTQGEKHKLLIGFSNVSGVGAFASQDVVKGGFLGEYVGEIITDDEAEIRAEPYMNRRKSFMFDFAFGLVLDAMNFGNALRFINHSSDRPNCLPCVKVVNGDLRIGLYALKDIKKKQEVLFDYGPRFDTSKFRQRILINVQNKKYLYFDEDYINKVNEEAEMSTLNDT